jgi:hypothetical protein
VKKLPFENTGNRLFDLLKHEFFVPLLEAECINIKFLVPVQDAGNAVGEHAKTWQYPVESDFYQNGIEPPREDRDEG